MSTCSQVTIAKTDIRGGIFLFGGICSNSLSLDIPIFRELSNNIFNYQHFFCLATRGNYMSAVFINFKMEFIFVNS
jgi:hypothetical protein